MKASREIVVGSSRKTSSRRVVCAIAASIEAVGLVQTSPNGYVNAVLDLCEFGNERTRGRRNGVAYCGNHIVLDRARTNCLVLVVEEVGWAWICH